MSAIQDFLTNGVFAFILTFVRLGTATMIMPGIGDSFVPGRIRLHVSLGMTLVLFPLVMPFLPQPIPGTFMLFSLVIMEFIIGLFIGTIARIFMMALDTAGMVISTSSGLANAQVFNPALATQGSLMGAFLSVTGVVIFFVANMHHLLIMGIMDSYNMFPVGKIPDTGSMAELMARAVSAAFMIGIQVSAPFMAITLLVYVGMGILSRLMPQIQVFLLAIPLQILLSLVTLTMVLSAGILFWLTRFEQSMVYFLSGG